MFSRSFDIPEHWPFAYKICGVALFSIVPDAKLLTEALDKTICRWLVHYIGHIFYQNVTFHCQQNKKSKYTPAVAATISHSRVFYKKNEMQTKTHSDAFANACFHLNEIYI